MPSLSSLLVGSSSELQPVSLLVLFAAELCPTSSCLCYVKFLANVSLLSHISSAGDVRSKRREPEKAVLGQSLSPHNHSPHNLPAPAIFPATTVTPSWLAPRIHVPGVSAAEYVVRPRLAEGGQGPLSNSLAQGLILKCDSGILLGVPFDVSFKQSLQQACVICRIYI